jgi:hypothetical protein
MRPECVVLFYSLSQVKPHSSDTVGNEITACIEFLAKGTVATFNATIVFWSGWRQYTQWDFHLLTCRLKVGHKLRPTIDLN